MVQEHHYRRRVLQTLGTFLVLALVLLCCSQVVPVMRARLDAFLLAAQADSQTARTKTKLI